MENQNQKTLMFAGNKQQQPIQLVLSKNEQKDGEEQSFFGYNQLDASDIFLIKSVEKNGVNSTLKKKLKKYVLTSSPNLIKLRRFEEIENIHYFAFELLNGGNLENYRLARGGHLQEQEARLILRQIIRGIQAIQEFQSGSVISNVLTSENIMISFAKLQSNEAQLQQFIRGFKFEQDHNDVTFKIDGVFLIQSEKPLNQIATKTLQMMAPEVLQGNYDDRAHVWSLGCLFYELLTGFKPFLGKNVKQLLTNIDLGSYAIPKTVHLSLEGAAFLNSCLQYEVGDRILWKDIFSHSYLLPSQYENAEEDLSLSYVQQGAKKTHKKIMATPTEWMEKNYELVTELNTRCADIFNQVYFKKYQDYYEQLDKQQQQQLDAPLIEISHPIQQNDVLSDKKQSLVEVPNLKVQNQVSNINLLDKVSSIDRISSDKEQNDFQLEVLKQQEPKFNYSENEGAQILFTVSEQSPINLAMSLVQEMQFPIEMQQSNFVDMVNASLYDLAQGKRAFVVRNLKDSTTPVGLDFFKKSLNKNYF